MASATYRTGRYSKVLPAHLRDRYQEAANDQNLLVMRDEVALLDTRLSELVGRLNQRDNAARWGAVRSAFRAYTEALDDDGDEPEKLQARRLEELRIAIYAGSDDDRVWDGIAEVTEQRRKLVESERKRLVDLQQMITAEQGMVLISQLAESVRRHVTDRSALIAIHADLARIVGGPHTQSAGSDSLDAG